MPTYVYACQECKDQFEKVLPITQNKAPQDCPKCGKVGTKVVATPSFMLKGDNWPGKSIALRTQMAAKNARIVKRQKDRGPVAKLLPNVGGERTDSWAEAKKLAESRGADTAAFDPLVAKEKR